MTSRDLAPAASSAAALRDRVLELVGRPGALPAPAADELRDLTAAWWREHEDRERRLAALSELHHEINNALVGVRGHVQLLLHAPAAADPKTRERLEVVLRESARIEKSVQQLRAALRAGGADVPSRAA